MSISIQYNMAVVKPQGQAILIRFNLLYLICLKSAEWNLFRYKLEFIINLFAKTVFYCPDFGSLSFENDWKNILIYLYIKEKIWDSKIPSNPVATVYRIIEYLVKLYQIFLINFQVLTA